MVGAFDTLRAARRLREAGASEPVADTIAEVLHESREFDLSQIATKVDLEQLRLATKADLEQLRLGTKADLDQLRLANKADLDQLRLATKGDLEQLRLANKADLEQLRLANKADQEQLRVEIANTKSEVLKWVIGLMVAQTAAIVGLIKLISAHG